ncbi:hypothetical protein C4K40_5947 [Pseudomonas sp. CMR5c]|nr:hypothetical protein C4K40_5947 [Pseudomonas sp. CMR5c]
MWRTLGKDAGEGGQGTGTGDRPAEELEGLNLYLTRSVQTIDRISRYFKAKISALIR